MKRRNEMSYEELVALDEYKELAIILVNDPRCRNDNALCIKVYFRKVYGVSLDVVVGNKDYPSIFTIERRIRQLKRLNPKLCGKNASQDKFKEIGLEIPVVTRVF